MKLRAAHSTVCLALGVLTLASNAGAQAAWSHERSSQYYAVHGGFVGAMLAGSVTAYYAFYPGEGPDFAWFPGDASLRGRRSGVAAELSNVTLGLSVGGPVFAQMGRGVDVHFANFGVVYGETVATNLLLNGILKLVVRRPRPYTYGLAEADDVDPRDRNTSFYSGHTSTSFAAAMAGSLLYTESAPNRASKVAVWGTELAFASATANLRVRAGKHYYSDVIVGALVGGGIGILVPVLHGARFAPEPAEYVAAGTGLLVGITASQLVPLRAPALIQHASFSWSLAPLAAPDRLGLTAHGEF